MVTDNFFPELGGIQDSIEATAAELGRRGHRIDILAPRYGLADYARVSGRGEPALRPGVEVHRLPSVPFPSSTGQSRLAAPWPVRQRLAALGPDVVHSHTFYGLGLAALFAARNASWRLVGTNHTAIAAFKAEFPIGMDQVVRYVRWYYDRCALVTAPAETVFGELGRGPRSPPLRIVSNPVATGLFRPAGTEARRAARAAFGVTGPALTYAGRLAPEKDVASIVRAMPAVRARFPDATLLVAGHGNQEARLRTEVALYGLGGHVRFLGTLAPSALARLFTATDVMVMMGVGETQGMAAMQAMACAVPVVAARARALPEYIDDTRGRLVPPHDPEALAAALIQILSGDVLRARLGSAAARFAAGFSTGLIADRWEAIYREVAACTA